MSKSLRFLFATAESHPTWRADVKTLFGKYLPMAGVQTDLLAIREPGNHDYAWAGGQAYLRSANSRLAIILADLLLQLSLFRRAFGGYDGIIVRDKPILAIFGFLAARLAGIPFIYWMSFPLPEAFLQVASDGKGRISPLRRLHLWLRGKSGQLILYRFLMHRADWVFAQSDYMIEDLRALGLRHERVSAVPMGVDIEALPPRPQQVPAALEGRRVGIYMGTLDRIRKPEILVDTARLVSRQVPDFTLLIVGDADEPSDRGWLKAYAQQIGAGHCTHFTGRVAQSEGMALARLALVGLSPMAPSHLTRTTSPTKPLEYLALNLPVVVNDLPDQARIVAASQCGWCVEFSAEQFAQAIIECLDNPVVAEQMAGRGRQWVQANRSYRALSDTVARTLRQVCSVSGSGVTS